MARGSNLVRYLPLTADGDRPNGAVYSCGVTNMFYGRFVLPSAVLPSVLPRTEIGLLYETNRTCSRAGALRTTM